MPQLRPTATPLTLQPLPAEDIIRFARERLGFEPDEHQTEILRSQARRGILNCTRQWGKSTVMAVKAVHRAWSSPGSLIVVASPSGRQSAEWMKKSAALTARLGIAVKGDGANEISLAFPNGSRIVGLPGMGTEGRIRGFSAVSLLLIDEAARVDDSIYTALRPMLAVGDGELWMISTPHGKRGFFWETWAAPDLDDSEPWTRLQVKGEACPRISRRHLAEERFVMTAARFAQEYECQFTDNGSSVFPLDLLEAALDDSIEPLNL